MTISEPGAAVPGSLPLSAAAAAAVARVPSSACPSFGLPLCGGGRRETIGRMARPRRQAKKTPRKRPQKRAPKRILNCIPSRDMERDFRMEDARAAGVVGDASVRVPASRDLRADWWKVADQGSTGSCVGWAAADGVVRWYLVKAGKLREDELLAPRFVWMAAKETDPFTTPADHLHRVGGHEHQDRARRRAEVRRRPRRRPPVPHRAPLQRGHARVLRDRVAAQDRLVLQPLRPPVRRAASNGSRRRARS